MSELEDLLRARAPQVLGTLLRRYGNDQFDLCEDAVQEALLEAYRQWPRDGVPDHPAGWLVTAARRRMIDRIRSDARRREREEAEARLTHPLTRLAHQQAVDEPLDTEIANGPDPDSADDTLRLLILCCHPRLTRSAQVALTLRAVAGLTTAQIARAYLLPEATIAQRIGRAKARIRAGGSQFAGDHAEAAGLLALMLLTDARRPARLDDHGLMIALDEQDRSLWDREMITEGLDLLHRTLPGREPTPYLVQAAIAALHAEAATAEDTDWTEILALYTVLERLTGNPMVSLSRAVAVAMVHGPQTGLTVLDQLAGAGLPADNHRLLAVRAHLSERAGGPDARDLYLDASRRTASTAERDYLRARARRLDR